MLWANLVIYNNTPPKIDRPFFYWEAKITDIVAIGAPPWQVHGLLSHEQVKERQVGQLE
jgi:hypothetical protein